METFSLNILTEAAFWATVGLTVAGALIAVFPRSILYNVLGLALALAGIAGFYLFLGSFFIAMIAIASVALVVGGIVIMNIMLVSVTERTREIGIRKALGARRQDVMRQFLIESSTMATTGGILGIVLGIAVAKMVTALIGMPSNIKLWAVLAALLVSASVGIFFGVYPARRAAELDPITALRFEL